MQAILQLAQRLLEGLRQRGATFRDILFEQRLGFLLAARLRKRANGRTLPEQLIWRFLDQLHHLVGGIVVLQRIAQRARIQGARLLQIGRQIDGLRQRRHRLLVPPGTQQGFAVKRQQPDIGG